MTATSERMDELSGMLGRERVVTDPGVLAGYAVDGVCPRALVFPKDTRQMARALGFAHQHGLTSLPRGSGTKLSMGYPPDRLDLLISTARMNHMLDVDTANLTITVEAGVKFRDIQARLGTEEDRCYLPLTDLHTDAGEFVCSDRSHSGCFLPMDPPFSEKATIGGIVAANSSGPRRLLYGLPRDLVLGVRFVTPEGEVVGAGGKTVKNVSGYDISKLMIGSFGTLGILCEMTLRLLPLPEQMKTLVLCFDDLSGAGEFVNRVVNSKLLPAALEVANPRAMDLLGRRFGLPPAAGSLTVLVALEAFDEALGRMEKEMLILARDCGATEEQVLLEDQHGRFWLAVGDLQTLAAEGFPHLVSVGLHYPLSEWQGMVSAVGQTLSGAGLDYSLLCHAGSGVCLVDVLAHSDSPDVQEKVTRVVHALLEHGQRAAGNLIVARVPISWKQDLPVWGTPGPDWGIMQALRARLDPSGLLSPGRFPLSAPEPSTP